MKMLLMFLVHRVEKIVRKLISRVESFCLGGMLSFSSTAEEGWYFVSPYKH